MAGAFVQSWEDLDTKSNTSHGLTVSAAANALLACGITFRAGAGTMPPSTPTGYTDLGYWDDGGINAQGAAWYRVASGDSNDNPNVSWSAGAESMLHVAEYSGLDTVSPLDSSVVSGTTGNNVSSYQAGAVTPNSQPGTLISLIGIRNGSDWYGTTSIDVGSVDTESNPSGSHNPSSAIASYNYTSTASINPTWSSSGGLDFVGVVQAAFKAAGGGGGGTILPLLNAYHG